jgi:hypothetical protein
MQQEGSRIYNAIFKRQWRCMKGEFEKLWILNATYLDSVPSSDSGVSISREDYLGDPRSIRPSADPNLTSSTMRMEQAAAMATRATAVGGYDKEAVERNLLRAMKVEAIDTFYPGLEKFPPPPNPHVMAAQIKADGDKAKAKGHLAEFLAKLQSEEGEVKARISLMEAQAAKALMDAEDADAAHKLAVFNAQIDAFKDVSGVYQKHIELLMSQVEQESGDGKSPNGGGATGMAGGSGNAGGSKSPQPA